MSVAAAPPAVLHLSSVVGGQLRDSVGGRLGTVDDVIVRLGDDPYPPVTGVLATVAGREVFVGAEQIDDISAGSVILRGSTLSVTPFARRPEEVLLRRDVLDRQLINVEGARLVRTNEIELARLEGWYRVVGVDTGPRGFVRRLLPRRAAARIGAGAFLDWASVEPFTGHVPTVRLRVPHPKLARLHPAELADLVEAASHREGEEIIASVRDDREREADVFEELDATHQREFLEERSDADVAGLLARMEPDDAADMVSELDEVRREAVLKLLPAPQRRHVRALLGYDPATAGGLMTTDFVCVFSHATRDEVIERLRISRAPADSLAWVFVMNERHRLRGAVHVVDLIRADPAAPMGEIALAQPLRLRGRSDLEEVARTMTDYDLTAVPVVDDQDRMIGLVTVDDVLELILPEGWRRNFGVFGGD
jgi:CBS domain-containing protein